MICKDDGKIKRRRSFLLGNDRVSLGRTPSVNCACFVEVRRQGGKQKTQYVGSIKGDLKRFGTVIFRKASIIYTWEGGGDWEWTGVIGGMQIMGLWLDSGTDADSSSLNRENRQRRSGMRQSLSETLDSLNV